MLRQNELCTGCVACYSICSQNAIKMVADEEGFLRPNIDEKKCIRCGMCEQVCPIREKNKVQRTENKKCYVARTKQEEKESTSGGIFAVAARYVLGKGGVVCGAAYDKNFKVVHCCITDKGELHRLQGSKYVQSEIGNSFKQVKKYLLSGKLVLFTGTACQVEGLVSYLGKKYSNLICMDIICHGVPSPKVWEKYLQTFHKKKKIQKVDFRDNKIKQEKIFSIQYENGKVYQKRYPKDPYIWGFCFDLFLRKSCYACQFKGENRNADITIGDAWGSEKYAHKMFTKDANNSLVLIHTDKGECLFSKMKEQLVFQEVNEKRAIANNYCFARSVSMNQDRMAFFMDLKKHCFQSVLLKYYWNGMWGKKRK